VLDLLICCPLRRCRPSSAIRATRRGPSAAPLRPSEPDPPQGLRPLLYAATSTDAFAGPYGSKDDASVTLDAFRAPVTDRGFAARVWDVTAELVGDRSSAGTTAR